MNMEDESGPASEVMPNPTRDGPVEREIVFTEGRRTNLDRREALSSQGDFLTFILCLGP